MVSKQEQKERTRKRMLEAAGKSFREHGFDGVGVDGIASAAGATSGAFYAHFGSKGGAFKTALEQGLDEVLERLPEFYADHGDGWPQVFADYYLGAEHRDDRACGCAMTALSPDVIRSNSELKALYQEKMERVAALIASFLVTGSESERVDRAWAFLSALIGGLVISRAVENASAADRIATATKQAALSALLSDSA